MKKLDFISLKNTKIRDFKDISILFVVLIIIITPFIDLANGILTNNFLISPGQVLRSIFMIIAFILVYLLSKKSFFYLSYTILTMLITLLIYFVIYNEFLLSQFIWDARILFTLLLTVLFINVIPILSKRTRDMLLDSLEFIVALISLVIIFSALTQTGYNTYQSGQGVGNKGFFIGQNDITAVISMVYPILVYKLISTNHHRTLRSCNLLVTLFAALLLGTKSGLFFIFASSLIVIMLFFNPTKVAAFIKVKSKLLIIVFSSVIILLTTFILFFKNSLENWINYQIYFLNNSNTFLTYLLSGRNKSIEPMFEILVEQPIFLLIGSTFTKGQELLSQKLGYPAFVEFDPLSILFYNGSIVFGLYFLVYINLFKYTNVLFKSTIEGKVLIISFYIGMLYSSLGGHVLSSGIAGTYFAFISSLVFFYGEKALENKGKVASVTKRIAILHSGNLKDISQGGVSEYVKQFILKSENAVILLGTENKSENIKLFRKYTRAVKGKDYIFIPINYSDRKPLSFFYVVNLFLFILFNFKFVKSITYYYAQRMEYVIPFYFFLRKKVFFAVHGSGRYATIFWGKRIAKIYAFIERLSVIRAQKVFVLNNNEDFGVPYYKKVYEKFSKKIFYTPVPIDQSFFVDLPKNVVKDKHNINKNSKVMLYFGRLEHNPKRIFFLPEIFKQVKLKYPDSIMLIIGSGKDKNELIKRFESLDLANDVILIEYLDHDAKLIETINCADVSLVCSSFEGICMSAIESLSCKVPVVATNVGSIKDYIIDGYNGYLIDEDKEEILIKNISDKVISTLATPLSFSNNLIKEYDARRVISSLEKRMLNQVDE